MENRSSSCSNSNRANSSSSADVILETSQNEECYVKKIENLSGLQLLQPNRVRGALDSHGPLGLFLLFFPKNEMERIRNLTNKNLSERPVLVSEMHAFFGLILATSFIRLPKLVDYWCTKPFSGNSDFNRTMSRNRFQEIKRALRICNGDMVSVEQKHLDPLWCFRPVF